MTFLRLAPVLCVSVVAACSPTLNWRDAYPDGSAVRLSFPCKPATRSRDVSLAGKQAVMRLHSCVAGVATFALTVLEIADPTLLPGSVDALKLAAIQNIDATSTSRTPFSVKGMVPAVAAEKLTSVGRLPDGSTVQQNTVFFVKRTQIYQATILNKTDHRLDADAVDTFFDSIAFVR
jgi:hypothetical protein